MNFWLRPENYGRGRWRWRWLSGMPPLCCTSGSINIIFFTFTFSFPLLSLSLSCFSGYLMNLLAATDEGYEGGSGGGWAAVGAAAVRWLLKPLRATNLRLQMWPQQQQLQMKGPQQGEHILRRRANTVRPRNHNHTLTNPKLQRRGCVGFKIHMEIFWANRYCCLKNT